MGLTLERLVHPLCSLFLSWIQTRISLTWRMLFVVGATGSLIHMEVKSVPPPLS